MKPKLLHAWVSNRANDLRMMLLVYTAATIATLFLIRDASSFGGEMQFAVAVEIHGIGIGLFRIGKPLQSRMHAAVAVAMAADG